MNTLSFHAAWSSGHRVRPWRRVAPYLITLGVEDTNDGWERAPKSKKGTLRKKVNGKWRYKDAGQGGPKATGKEPAIAARSGKQPVANRKPWEVPLSQYKPFVERNNPKVSRPTIKTRNVGFKALRQRPADGQVVMEDMAGHEMLIPGLEDVGIVVVPPGGNAKKGTKHGHLVYHADTGLLLDSERMGEGVENTLRRLIQNISKAGGPAGVHKSMASRRHKMLVQKAITDGIQVPDDVLADYPDLSAKK